MFSITLSCENILSRDKSYFCQNLLKCYILYSVALFTQFQSLDYKLPKVKNLLCFCLQLSRHCWLFKRISINGNECTSLKTVIQSSIDIYTLPCVKYQHQAAAQHRELAWCSVVTQKSGMEGRQDQERANICIHVADSRFMEKLTQYCKAIIFQF